MKYLFSMVRQKQKEIKILLQLLLISLLWLHFVVNVSYSHHFASVVVVVPYKKFKIVSSETTRQCSTDCVVIVYALELCFIFFCQKIWLLCLFMEHKGKSTFLSDFLKQTIEDKRALLKSLLGRSDSMLEL